MAVSKSYSNNKPMPATYSGIKGYHSKIKKPAQAPIYNAAGETQVTDLGSKLGGLSYQLLNVFTQQNSYFLKTGFNAETSLQFQSEAEQALKYGAQKTAVILFEKALQQNPNNTGARESYAALLSKTGRHEESGEQFRLAREIKKFQSRPLKKQLPYQNPLLFSHRVAYQFESSYAENTPVPENRFPGNLLQVARVACLLAVLALAMPFSPVAAGKSAEQQQTMGQAKLEAYVVDENNQAWNETVQAELYRGAIHPDSLIKTGILNTQGELRLENINTGAKTTKLPKGSYKTYPTAFDQQAIMALQLEAKADVTLNLYNLLGQRIWSKELQERYPGLIEEAIPGRNLADGTYIAEVITNKDGEVKKGTSKIIKQAGASTGYKTGMPLEKSAYLKSGSGRHILVLDGDFTKETVIEGIGLPSGETTDLGTITAEIEPTIITATVKDQDGENWDSPHKGTVYENGEKIGEEEITQGQLEIPTYIKKPTNVITKINGPDMQEEKSLEKTITQAGIKELGEIVIGAKSIMIGPVFDVETAWDGLDPKEPTKLAGMEVYLYANGTETKLTTGTDGTAKIKKTQINPIDSIIIANPGTDTTWYEWKRTDVKGQDTITAYFDDRGIPLFKQEMLPGQTADIDPKYNKEPYNSPLEGMDLLEYIKMTREGTWPGTPIEGAFGRFPDHMLPIKICITHSEDGREPANENYTLGARDAIEAVSIGRFQFKEVPLEEAVWKFDMYSRDYGRTNSHEYIEFDNQGNIIYTHMEGALTQIQGPPHGEFTNRKLIATLFAHELLQPSQTEYSPYIEDNFFQDTSVKVTSGAPLESYRENRATKIQYDMANMVRFKDYAKNWK